MKRASNYFQTVRDYSERSRKHAAALVRRSWGYPRSRTKIEICQNPIFIIGSPRSGTSALGWALGEHSQLATLVESSILAVLFQGRYAEKAYETAKARRNGRDWVMRYNVSRSEFVGYLGAGLNALMASRIPGPPRPKKARKRNSGTPSRNRNGCSSTANPNSSPFASSWMRCAGN